MRTTRNDLISCTAISATPTERWCPCSQKTTTLATDILEMCAGSTDIATEHVWGPLCHSDRPCDCPCERPTVRLSDPSHRPSDCPFRPIVRPTVRLSIPSEACIAVRAIYYRGAKMYASFVVSFKAWLQSEKKEQAHSTQLSFCRALIADTSAHSITKSIL